MGNPFTATHRNNSGTMLIAEMLPSHLINTIKLICRQIGEVRGRLKASEERKVDFNARLLGAQEISEEDAIERIRELAERLSPYLVEALIQGVAEQVRDDVCAALGRSHSASMTFTALPDPRTAVFDGLDEVPSK